MRSRSLVLSLAFLFGLFHLRVLPAGTRDPDPRADLVVVLNITPANPSGGEIWLMDLNGKPVRRITQNNYHEEYPSFSPDGNKIAFVRNLGQGVDPKNNEIFVYDLRAGVETRLTRNSVEDSHPEWSFDGKYIAFHSRRADPQERATLWIMEADGSHPRQVSQLLPGDFSHLDPNWGPDGQWLAFVNYREEAGRLMDWDSKSWVTVFVRSGISAEAVEVRHEIAPANFISRDTREVALRIVALAPSAALFPALETRQLSLDVKRIDREG